MTTKDVAQLHVGLKNLAVAYEIAANGPGADPRLRTIAGTLAMCVLYSDAIVRDSKGGPQQRGGE